MFRVSYAPGELPRLGDLPGAGRFDDPRPRTIDRFLIRYAATTVRGCLLELMAAFRPDPEAERRVAEIDADDDPEYVEEPPAPPWQALADYLTTRKVVHLDARDLSVASINDAAIQQMLDIEPVVRAVLDSEEARAALLEKAGRHVHLDNAAVRLSSQTGRFITQACALALYDRPDRPDVIHYRSRHDDTEDCWAIFGDVEVDIGTVEQLSPDVAEHAQALRAVAELWNLPLPPAWA